MQRFIMILFAFFVLYQFIFISHSTAAIIQLPQTGQTSCYDSAGTLLLSCAGTGQDGDIQAGKAWPFQRFTDNSITTAGDLTVTDKLTGLIWAKDANLMKTRDPSFDTDEIALDGMVTWRVERAI
jgi:hypothetical protein